jgi:hypothetical protein
VQINRRLWEHCRHEVVLKEVVSGLIQALKLLVEAVGAIVEAARAPIVALKLS